MDDVFAREERRSFLVAKGFSVLDLGCTDERLEPNHLLLAVEETQSLSQNLAGL